MLASCAVIFIVSPRIELQLFLKQWVTWKFVMLVLFAVVNVAVQWWTEGESSQTGFSRQEGIKALYWYYHKGHESIAFHLHSLLKCSVWRTVLFFFIIWQAFHWSKVALFWWNSEFWKHIPPNEPFRVLLGDMRDRMYYTRERMRQLLATGKSDINVEDTFTNALQVISQRHSNLSLHKNWKLIQYHMLDFNRQW